MTFAIIEEDALALPRGGRKFTDTDPDLKPTGMRGKWVELPADNRVASGCL
jgi:hypothetical protein